MRFQVAALLLAPWSIEFAERDLQKAVVEWGPPTEARAERYSRLWKFEAHEAGAPRYARRRIGPWTQLSTTSISMVGAARPIPLLLVEPTWCS